MWQAEGCEVFLYGPDEIDCSPDEHIVITTASDRERWGFGDGFDTARTPFLWDSSQPYWFEANQKAIDALRSRVEPRDYLCLIAGWTQEPIAREISGVYVDGELRYTRGPIAVEWGCGYEGIFSPFVAFESYAWLHHNYGLQRIINGRAYDQVIPNFFDKTQFSVARNPSLDYLLYIGRVVQRKGPHIALEIARHVGLPLYVAGPGPTSWENGKFLQADEVRLEGDVHYMGEVRFKERNELMRNAVATIVPTLYIEPFGGVAVEAMLSGCPVIASDWGSFTEIVGPEVGRRFRTLKQGVRAVGEVRSLSRKKIRDYAISRYSLEAVGPQFTAWFDQMDDLWKSGWPEV
jgi:glycosyltransferase involved in cell wall biosynthesis